MAKLILLQKTVDYIYKKDKDYIYTFNQYGEPEEKNLYQFDIKYWEYDLGEEETKEEK